MEDFALHAGKPKSEFVPGGRQIACHTLLQELSGQFAFVGKTFIRGTLGGIWTLWLLRSAARRFNVRTAAAP